MVKLLAQYCHPVSHLPTLCLYLLGEGSSPNVGSLFPLLVVLRVSGMYWFLPPHGLGYSHACQASMWVLRLKLGSPCLHSKPATSSVTSPAWAFTFSKYIRAWFAHLTVPSLMLKMQTHIAVFIRRLENPTSKNRLEMQLIKNTDTSWSWVQTSLWKAKPEANQAGSSQASSQFPLQNSFLPRAGLAQGSQGCYWFPRKPQTHRCSWVKESWTDHCAFWISPCKHGDSLFPKKRKRKRKGEVRTPRGLWITGKGWSLSAAPRRLKAGDVLVYVSGWKVICELRPVLWVLLVLSLYWVNFWCLHFELSFPWGRDALPATLSFIGFTP